MRSRRGNKLKDKGLEVNRPMSKKIEKSSARKKKKALKTTLTLGAVVGTTSNVSLPTVDKSVSRNVKKKEKINAEGTSGFIFMCNGKTKPECYRLRVFGLPAAKVEVVKKIKPGTKLFLFDVGLKLLYGIYKATCNGGSGLEPTAFQGNFPAQVRFKIYKDCLPLHERAFKNAIQDNYEGGTKFRPDLNRRQVEALLLLFRPIYAPLPPSIASPRTIPAPLSEQWVRPPPMLPPMEDPYLYSVHHSHAPVVLDPRYAQVAPYTLYSQYGLAPNLARGHPSIEALHVPLQIRIPHRTDPYYLTEAHQAYLPEEPALSTHNPQKRYWVAQEMVRRDQLLGLGSQYQMPQYSREEDNGSTRMQGLMDYYARLLPSPIASHSSLQSHTAVPPYTPLPSTHAPGELSSSYQRYYATMPTNQEASRGLY